VNFERVAVDNAGLPGMILCERWRDAKACRRDKQLREPDRIASLPSTITLYPVILPQPHRPHIRARKTYQTIDGQSLRRCKQHQAQNRYRTNARYLEMHTL
jgi:hypothetical protein